MEYGRYLANIAECSFCHGADFAGGRLFRIPDSDQTRVAANLTPHPSSRSAAWTRESFVAVFKSFTPPVEHEAPGLRIPDDGRNTVMPWSRYAGMSEDDLSAIYEYLRTLDPAGSASNE